MGLLTLLDSYAARNRKGFAITADSPVHYALVSDSIVQSASVVETLANAGTTSETQIGNAIIVTSPNGSANSENS